MLLCKFCDTSPAQCRKYLNNYKNPLFRKLVLFLADIGSKSILRQYKKEFFAPPDT
jgi:hypothetical protein